MDKIQLTLQQKQKLLEMLQTGESLQQQLADLESCGENCELRKLKLQAYLDQGRQLIQRFGGQ